ncbi:hypothetical protein POF45_08875 [Pseudomonas sp. 681]|uniref:Uncharacterized protein n=1 Tax=Pseudomonas fungipugnans TaxID=3024217 RepID=A0ABT6QKY0_9PSED|nr:hypothetical protein [Pseudomonas sp. 681]MDI2591535.1 hypothetical protein [Pseudomonas sp. 681]
MLVSAQKATIIQPTLRQDMDPTTAAASALYSGLIQSAQNNAVPQPAQDSNDALASDLASATQQVGAASTISDNIDEAFAKTRVNLQATDASTASTAATSTDSAAMTDFKDYMSKTPEQRLRDSVLQEMGITEDQLKAMPPEKQLAVSKEIAQRLEDKVKLAKADNENGNTGTDVNQPQATEKLLASL